MDNFKYSLKTNQFNKKRQQIFVKEVQKESVSLEVHQPKNSVENLLDFNKSQDHYGLIQYFGTNQSNKEPSQSQQQSRTVKFSRSKHNLRKMSQAGIGEKPRNVCHSISASPKIKIPPINPQLSRSKTTENEVTGQEIEVLKYILYKNEQNLKNLTESLNTLYRSTLQLYNNHERKMREIVNNRCYQVVRIYKRAVMQIRDKQKNIEQIDAKISLLLNTVNNNIDILRVTKIRQECIEALQMEQKKLFQQKQKQLQIAASRKTQTKQSSGNGSSFLKLNISQVVDRNDTKQKNKINSAKEPLPIHTFRRQNPKQYFTVRSTSNQIENSVINDSHFQFINYGDKSSAEAIQIPASKLLMESLEHKKSPFQANQLLLISNTMLVQKAQQNFVQVSFRKFGPYSEKYQLDTLDNVNISNNRHFNSPVQPYRCRSLTQSVKTNQFQNDFHTKKTNRDQYEQLRQKIKKLLKQNPIKQVWIDNLNCLRRKNGTYILDLQGNAIICSPDNYQRLISEQIIIRPQF